MTPDTDLSSEENFDAALANIIEERLNEDESSKDDARPAPLLAAGEQGDDPVRLYLKEIGRVDLLSADQEFWLGIRILAIRTLDALRYQMQPSRR